MNNLIAGAGNSFNGNITNPTLGDKINIQLGGGSDVAFLSGLVSKGVGLIFIFGAVGFFFMFVWGAVSWILSGGDKAHVEAAKGRITNAFLGLVLLFASIAIVQLIEFFFGIDILLIDIGPLLIQ
jgi:hypothetical protein